MRGNLSGAAVKVCAIMALLGPALPTAPASASPSVSAATTAGDCDHVHIHNVTLRLSGTISGAKENIDVKGKLDVRVKTCTEARDVDPEVSVVSRLVDTTGIGQTSGGTYRFNGSDAAFLETPPQPIRLTFTPTFIEVPPQPIAPPQPIRFLFLAVPISADGSIGDITVSFIGGGGGGTT